MNSKGQADWCGNPYNYLWIFVGLGLIVASFLAGTWYVEGQVVTYYLGSPDKKVNVLQEHNDAFTYDNVCQMFGFSRSFIGCDGSYAQCSGKVG